jgi:hypothetical protein
MIEFERAERLSRLAHAHPELSETSSPKRIAVLPDDRRGDDTTVTRSALIRPQAVTPQRCCKLGRSQMAIASAVKRDNYVYVCDSTGRQLCAIYVGGGSLQGYTASTVSVHRDNYVYMYDETGRQLSATYAG